MVMFIMLLMLFCVMRSCFSNTHVLRFEFYNDESKLDHSRLKRSWYLTEEKISDWNPPKKQVKELFSLYYKCLKSKSESASSRKIHDDIHPILALEGQTIRLECPVCIRPGLNYDLAGVFWQHLQRETGELKYVEPSSRVGIKDDMSLMIKTLDITDAGQYYCVRSRDREYERVYQLDVLFREKRILYNENEKNVLLKVDNRSENNLSIFTKWSEWSNCNICGKIGQRRKVGLCMVRKMYPKKPLFPEDVPIIDLYPEGIPCRSTVLPDYFQSLWAIKGRKSETLLGECFVQCPTEPPVITVTDANGKILDTIPAGFYPIGKKPSLPPLVIRKVVYEVTKKNIVLKCPVSNSNKNTNIRWQNGSKVIDPLTIRRRSRGRIMIDITNRLHIRDLRLYDTAVYNCWLKRWRVATIKLIVTKAFNHKVKDYITYTGLALTIVCMALVCFLTCCRRTAQRTR